jgi:hypothetical protein
LAHSWRKDSRRLTALWAAALVLVAPATGAIALGDPEVRSALGEPLDLRIPVTIGSGESIEPSCFTLARQPAADVPRLTGARVSLQRSAAGSYLRIESGTSINEPALVLGIIAACPGQAGEYKREYSVLLDPRRGALPAAAAESAQAVAVPGDASAAPAAATVRSITATLMARIGDTLESIANAIFPRNRAARKSYIEALRESNPPLAVLADKEPIPIDTPIALPDLRTFARARPGPGTQIASAPRATAAPLAATSEERAAPPRGSARPRSRLRRWRRPSAPNPGPQHARRHLREPRLLPDSC